MDSHHGRIECHSEVGKMTMFSISLPIESVAVANDAKAKNVQTLSVSEKIMPSETEVDATNADNPGNPVTVLHCRRSRIYKNGV